MKTFVAKPATIERSWYIIDATDLVLGRLASQIAIILRGKHKPYYTPFLDCGDNVVVINAAKIALTGKKCDRNHGKKYYRHTGHPGGIKEVTAGELIHSNRAERVIEKAVQRMISRNVLGRQQMRKLHIYNDDQHPHQGQQPHLIEISVRNRKNKVEM